MRPHPQGVDANNMDNIANQMSNIGIQDQSQLDVMYFINPKNFVKNLTLFCAENFIFDINHFISASFF